MGGQVHVFCSCAGDGSFPLIVTGRKKEDKRTCMITDCNRKEHYVCCNERSCKTRICYSHFEEYCKGEPRWLTPPTDEENEILAEPGPEDSCACDEEQNLEDNAAVECQSHMHAD